ncbi:MAG TPA: TIGR03943 family protein [Spirochaetota bacterium]|nr:TIGR03943 family protein [Spirochaetota bacterium]HPJ34287.1 TIGR03943 family protein [Spirochaetota bacterium]
MKLLRYIYLFREFILLSFLFMTLERMVSGRQLYAFLNPAYHVFVHSALITVFILMVAALFIASGRKIETEMPREYLKYIIFIVLIALLNVGPDSGVFNAHVSDSSDITPEQSMGNFAAGGDISPGADHDIYQTSGDFIEITRDNYYFLVNDMYACPEKYEGKRVSIDGFVYKSKKLGKDEFIIARLIIYCCAVHAGMGGLISDAEEIKESFRKDEWLRVDGTVKLDKSRGERTVPVLMLKSFRRIPPERDPYIYPVYN